MGEMAEDAVIAIAGSADPRACLAAVQLLGEIGTKKSMLVLRKGLRSGNPQVRLAAKVSLDQVRSRQSDDQ
jgi:HEAT repeat protein